MVSVWKGVLNIALEEVSFIGANMGLQATEGAPSYDTSL